MLYNILLFSTVLMQSIEVSDITSLTALKEISLNGLLFLALYVIWKEKQSLKEELKTERKDREDEKDKERDRYFDALLKANQTLDENTRTLNDVKKVLDK